MKCVSISNVPFALVESEPSTNIASFEEFLDDLLGPLMVL